MVVAADGHCKKRRLRADMCRKLLHLGADRNLTDPAGRTALGMLFKAHRAEYDMLCVLEDNPTDWFFAEFEELKNLLRPTRGPTEAERAYVEDEEDLTDGWDGSDTEQNNIDNDDDDDE